VARETESIEREIEAARAQLASTLDELSVRANPKNIVASTKAQLLAKLGEPKVKYSLIGAGAAVVVIVLVKTFR
jgi:Protein of unknown function (DUF3618)